jgi:hypothetical protein
MQPVYFRKLRGVSLDQSSPVDTLITACIRRANIDAFWSRATSTVHGNWDKVEDTLRLSCTLGLEGPFRHEGPLPDFDHCGYEIAYNMLLISRRPGVYSKEYTQWETIRKAGSAIDNQQRASPQATSTVMALGDENGNYYRISSDPVSSV